MKRPMLAGLALAVALLGGVAVTGTLGQGGRPAPQSGNGALLNTINPDRNQDTSPGQ